MCKYKWVESTENINKLFAPNFVQVHLQEHWAPLNVKKYLHGFLCKYKWGESTENINQIEMSVSEILNIGSAAAGITSV